MEKRFSYGRHEKLKSRKDIQNLFERGHSFNHYPLKVFYFSESKEDQSSKIQTAVGVSKRHFKKAVQRNKIKRVLREAYRLNKTLLTKTTSDNNLSLNVFFLYTSSNVLNSREITVRVQEAIQKINQKIAPKVEENK